MKKSIKFLVYPLALIAISLFVIVGCSDDDTEPKFALSLEVYPEGAGDVTGSGEHPQGEEINIVATPIEGWGFKEWTGDIDYVNDPISSGTIINMPAYDINLTANFDVMGHFTYEGQTFKLDHGFIINYGYWWGGCPYFEVFLHSEGIEFAENFMDATGQGHGILLEMCSPDEDGLSPGTYVYDYNNLEDPFKFHTAYILMDWDTETNEGLMVHIVGGSLQVEKFGSSYAIQIDATGEDGKEVSGYFKGLIPIYDAEDKEREKILEYIDENDLDAYEHESGIFVAIEEDGTGEPPGSTSVVLMSYHGYLIDGETFDIGENVYINLSDVIPGFRLGVMEFGRGGKGTILIPSRLGYGPGGSGEIPGNAVLIFDIIIIDY